MTGKELAKKDQGVALATIDEQTLKDYLFGLKDPINEKQQNLFMQIAKANNLNPFKREVYAVGYGDSFSIITGYQVYIDKANATGLLNGWSCEVIKNDDGSIAGARVTIHRKDWTNPFIWEIDFDEFAGTYFDKFKKKQVLNKIWASKGKFMIKKVAIGQGFRLCFPSELGGLPYLAEEIANRDEKEIMDGQIDDQDDATEVIETPPEVKTPPVKKTPVKKETPKVEGKSSISDDQIKNLDKTIADVNAKIGNDQKESTLDDIIDAMPDDDALDQIHDAINDEIAPNEVLSSNKIKEVQIKWKEFASTSGWNFEESERKRKATMKKYWDVESAKEMTSDQADEFIAKIDQAIAKIVY